MKKKIALIRLETCANGLPSLLPDVDAPKDLAASNIQTESGMLTWKPPRADISGYILSFESVDGTVRVSADVCLKDLQHA